MNRGRGQQNGDDRRQQPVGGPIGMVVRGLAAGIGLASESYQRHKEKKASTTQAGPDTDDSAAPPQQGHEWQHDAHLAQQRDEAAWELDEAQDDMTARPTTTEQDPSSLAAAFLAANPQPTPSAAAQPPLALPVVITQRRPGNRTKGFVRAYAPTLAAAGIDQPTFLDFLTKLNKAVEPSPWIQAVNLAALAGHKVPEPFTIIISIAVKMAADAASELHSRAKTNHFLDRVNADFFAPRGLVALVLTWKPSARGEVLTTAEFDTVQAAVAKGGKKAARTTFESSSGASSFEWPETAPLVFPALEELADNEAAEGKTKSAVKRSGKFVGEYMDRRARAKWAGENPESSMANATGKETFASKYADPNHPASSGDPVALLTGGVIQGGFGRGVGGERRGLGGMRGGLAGREIPLGFGRGRVDGWQRGGESSRGGGRQGLMGPGLGRGRLDGFQRGGGGGGSSRGGSRSELAGGGLLGLVGGGPSPLNLIGGVKKLLQDDILYLLIIQQPTEDQMAQAAERIRSWERDGR